MKKPTEAEMKACCVAMGWDWNKIDWSKVYTFLQTVLSLLNRHPVMSTSAGDASVDATAVADCKAALEKCCACVEKCEPTAK